MERVERRLAAIVAADVAGYSRLMGADEEGTLAQLKAHRLDLIDPKITEHRGHIVKTTGDGMLVEFASAVNAVRCAAEVQRGMAERNAEVPAEKRVEFRVGINVGDIIADGGDIFGDGVNIAARLEALAEPGGICVSEVVRDQVRDKLGITFEATGEQQLKNITRPVRVYRVRFDGAATRAALALPLPDKPSIAVLPFQNMSGDHEQEYFADGVVEEIITALSRFQQLFVIARNSSFTYKGRAVDVKQVGRELGVRYVLEGSVRKSANRVRITGQLIDSATGAHLWADRFDGGLEDYFDLQDQVTTNVVGAIAPKLEQAEIERAKRKPTDSLDAYDHYLRGLANYHQWTEEANSEALRLFQKVIELDPDFASAYGWAAACYIHRKLNGWMNDHDGTAAAQLALRAADLGRNDAEVLAEAGFVIAYVVGDLDSGAAFVDQALSLNPNLASAWRWGGWIKIWLRDLEIALGRFKHAMRLSPLDPLSFLTHAGIAAAHFYAGRYDEASLSAEKAGREKPSSTLGWRYAAASHALAGRKKEAQKAMEQLRKIDPILRVSNLKERGGTVTVPDYFARYEEGLRKAGLPE